MVSFFQLKVQNETGKCWESYHVFRIKKIKNKPKSGQMAGVVYFKIFQHIRSTAVVKHASDNFRKLKMEI